MDTRQIRYFLAVVEHGGFGRAAAALNVAQPTMSQSVKALERDVGTALFHRASHGVTLSAAGRAFLGPARLLMRDVAVAGEAVGGRPEHDSLEIVASAPLGAHPGAALVGGFLRAHPGVSVSLDRDTDDGLLARVRDGVSELGLVHLPAARQGLCEVELGAHDLVLVFPPPDTGRLTTFTAPRADAARPTAFPSTRPDPAGPRGTGPTQPDADRPAASNPTRPDAERPDRSSAPHPHAGAGATHPDMHQPGDSSATRRDSGRPAAPRSTHPDTDRPGSSGSTHPDAGRQFHSGPTAPDADLDGSAWIGAPRPSAVPSGAGRRPPRRQDPADPGHRAGQRDAAQVGVWDWTAHRAGPERARQVAVDVVHLADLAGVDLLGVPRGSASRLLVEAALRAAGVRTRVVVESGQRDLITDLVIAGVGAAFMPDVAAGEAAARGAVIRRVVPALRLPYGLVHRAGELSATARAFIEYTLRQG